MGPRDIGDVDGGADDRNERSALEQGQVRLLEVEIGRLSNDRLVLLRPRQPSVGGPDYRRRTGTSLGKRAVEGNEKIAVGQLADRAVGGRVPGVVGADDDLGRSVHRRADLDQVAPGPAMSTS